MTDPAAAASIASPRARPGIDGGGSWHCQERVPELFEDLRTLGRSSRYLDPLPPQEHDSFGNERLSALRVELLPDAA